MLIRVLVLLVALFFALGALRIILAPPRPRWVQSALVGVIVALPLLVLRMGAVALVAGALVAGAIYVNRKPRTAADPELARARAVLGVGPEAGEAEIRAAHRRRITEAHPDRGGADARAAALNAARDVLLRRSRTTG